MCLRNPANIFKVGLLKWGVSQRSLKFMQIMFISYPGKSFQNRSSFRQCLSLTFWQSYTCIDGWYLIGNSTWDLGHFISKGQQIIFSPNDLWRKVWCYWTASPVSVQQCYSTTIAPAQLKPFWDFFCLATPWFLFFSMAKVVHDSNSFQSGSLGILNQLAAANWAWPHEKTIG